MKRWVAGGRASERVAGDGRASAAQQSAFRFPEALYMYFGACSVAFAVRVGVWGAAALVLLLLLLVLVL
jgi:hypothetical protein